jgi:hypothetical protein
MNRNISLKEFIELALLGNLWNHHWDVASRFLPPRVDHLFPLETLSVRFSAMCEILGIENSNLPHARKSKKRVGHGVFDKDLTKTVIDFYHEDFEQFGYSLNPKYMNEPPELPTRGPSF